MRHPIEAEHSLVTFRALTGDHNIVAAFGVVIVVAATARDDVVAAGRDNLERISGVALQ